MKRPFHTSPPAHSLTLTTQKATFTLSTTHHLLASELFQNEKGGDSDNNEKKGFLSSSGGNGAVHHGGQGHHQAEHLPHDHQIALHSLLPLSSSPSSRSHLIIHSPTLSKILGENDKITLYNVNSVEIEMMVGSGNVSDGEAFMGNEDDNLKDCHSLTDSVLHIYYELTEYSQILLEKNGGKHPSGERVVYEIAWDGAAGRWSVIHQPSDIAGSSIIVKNALKLSTTAPDAQPKDIKFPMINQILNKEVNTDILIGVIVDYKNIGKKSWFTTSLRLMDESSVDQVVQVNIFSEMEIEIPYVLQVGQIIVISGVCRDDSNECYFRTVNFKRVMRYMLIDRDEYLDEKKFRSLFGPYQLFIRLKQLQEFASFLVADIPAKKCLQFDLKIIENLFEDPADLSRMDLIARVKEMTLEDSFLHFTLEDGLECRFSADSNLCACVYMLRHVKEGETFVKFRDLSVEMLELFEFVIHMGSNSSVAILPNDHICARKIQERILQRSLEECHDSIFDENNTFTQKSATTIVANPIQGFLNGSSQEEAYINTEELTHSLLQKAPLLSIRQLLMNPNIACARLHAKVVKCSSIDRAIRKVCIKCGKERIDRLVLCTDCGKTKLMQYEFEAQLLIEDDTSFQMPIALVSNDASFFFQMQPFANRVTRRILIKKLNQIQSASMCEIYVEALDLPRNGNMEPKRLWYCTHTRMS